MKFKHILRWAAGTPWAIEPAKAMEIMQFMSLKAAGGHVVSERVAGFRSATQARRGGHRGAGRVREKGPAVLGIYGVISPRIRDVEATSGPGGTSAEAVARQIRLAARDTAVSSIILDVDSPGGSVFGVPEAGEAIIEARQSKRVIAVVNHFCASAAYWLATQADEIVMTRSSKVGSIGVMIYHEDMSKALKKRGIQPNMITFGKNKGEGHPAFPLSDESRAYLQVSADEYGRQFVEAVASGRGVTTETVMDKFGQGRMFGANEAIRLGMADRIGTLEQVWNEQSAQKKGSGRLVSVRERRLRLAARKA